MTKLLEPLFVMHLDLLRAERKVGERDVMARDYAGLGVDGADLAAAFSGVRL
jgi:hypothetical protein